MPFDNQVGVPPLAGGPSSDSISDVRASFSEGMARISWTSTEPEGRYFQLYVGGRLAWSGTARDCYVPVPATTRSLPCQIIAVDSDASQEDHSSYLDVPAWGGTTVLLQWNADPDSLERFDVYQGPLPGSDVDYDLPPVASVAASPGGVYQNGFGMGGFGEGGFGGGSSRYSWRSGPLAPGVWSFGVVSVSVYGTRSTPWESSTTVSGPPQAPPPDSDGARLRGVYSPTTRRATLSWEASSP